MDSKWFDEEYYTKGTKSGYGATLQTLMARYTFCPANSPEYYESQMRAAISIVTELHPKSVLDVGCAFGAVVKALRTLGVDAYGIDFSEYAISHAEPELSPFLRVADATNLSVFADKQFDLSLCKDVLEHIPKSKVLSAVREVCRVSSQYVMVFIPIVDNGLDPSHCTIESADWWTDLFHAQGFVTHKSKILTQLDDIISFVAQFRRFTFKYNSDKECTRF